MAELTKKLKYQASTGAAGTITLYSTAAEAGDKWLNLSVNGANAYAALGAVSDPNASNLRVVKGGTTYAILKEAFKRLVLTDNKYRMKQIYPRTCKTLTEIPDELDTSNLTTMYAMFWGCRSLTTIPQLDASKVTDAGRAFSETKITTIDWIDLSNATTVQAIFDGCVYLKSIPQLNISKATDSHQMFTNCKSITSIPELDTGNVVAMRNMFEGCTSLPAVFPWVINMEKVNTTSGDGYQNMFTGSSVTKVRVKRTAKDLDANKMKSGGITIEYV